MNSNIDLGLYEKRHTAFHRKRVERAKAQAYDAPVTAFLSDVFIASKSAVGITFDHKKQNALGRFADGHMIYTSDIQGAKKQGRFWVLTTLNSTYVVTSFKRQIGRASLRMCLSILKNNCDHKPERLH
jgi:hypothetical protein